MNSSGGLVVIARRLDMPRCGNSLAWLSLTKWPAIVYGLEAATHSLIRYLLINQLLLVNGGDSVVISPGLARLGSLAMAILGWRDGVS